MGTSSIDGPFSIVKLPEGMPMPSAWCVVRGLGCLSKEYPE